jgi:quercetin dioxygenase-like cupin family protein
MNKTEINKDNSMRNSYWLLNARLRVLAGHAETGGRFDLVEGWFPPGTLTPPHRHGAYSELIYVLDGEFTVWAGGRKAVLRRGDNHTIPAGTAHVVAATSGGPARALVIASPSGFARLITEVGTPVGGDGMPPSALPDLEPFLRVSAELGDEILGPPGALPD